MTEWSMSFLELISFSVNRNVDVLDGNFHARGMRPGYALDENDGRCSLAANCPRPSDPLGL
jgi:hypothetical protein